MITNTNGKTEEAHVDTPETVRGIRGSLEMGLHDLLAIAFRQKGIIIFGFLAGLALAILYYVRATPIYESGVKILVMQKDSRLPTKGADADRVDQASPTDDLLATHVEMFKSPLIVSNAVEKNQLRQLPTFREQLAEDPAFSPVGFIIENLEVARGGEGQSKSARVLKASFRSPSADDCVRVLNALVESYHDFLGETFQDASSEAVTLINRAKVELESELTDAESSYVTFRENAPLIWDGDKSANPHQEQLKELGRSLLTVQMDRARARTRLEVIEEALKSGKLEAGTSVEKLALIGGQDVQRLSLFLSAVRGDTNSEAFLSAQPVRQGIANTEFERVLSLILQERELLQTYAQDHPAIQKIRDQISVARQYLESKGIGTASDEVKFDPAELLRAQVAMLQYDINEFDKREQQLNALIDQERAGAKSVVTSELKANTMQSDIERKKLLYDAVVERLREINLIKDYGAFITEVIAPVSRAVKPVAPRLLLVLALGCFMGLFCGAGLGYLIDEADSTFRSPDEIQRGLRLPILADMPQLDRTAKQAADTNGDKSLKIDTTIVAYHRPRSSQAEVIRGLRTAVYFAFARDGKKVIQITSPQPGDGKTTLVCNLAVSIAQSGKRVLLIDADLRNPRVHKNLGIDASRGLSSVISAEVDLSDAVQDLGIENLSVLPAGTTPKNPAEMLTSPGFEHVLQLAREQYDYVLIDTPPLLLVSDPVIIAPQVDSVVMAIRIRKNGAPGAMHARRMLAGTGAHVLGVVVNGMERNRHYGYGYGGRYSYGYSYGRGYGYGGYGYGYGSYYGPNEQEAAKKYYVEDDTEKPAAKGQKSEAKGQG